MSVAAATPAEQAPGRLALTAFVGAVVIGGSNFVAVRYSNRELDPLWGAALRFGLAAAVFALLCAGLRLALPRGRELGLSALYGLLGFGGAYPGLLARMRNGRVSALVARSSVCD